MISPCPAWTAGKRSALPLPRPRALSDSTQDEGEWRSPQASWPAATAESWNTAAMGDGWPCKKKKERESECVCVCV